MVHKVNSAKTLAKKRGVNFTVRKVQKVQEIAPYQMMGVSSHIIKIMNDRNGKKEKKEKGKGK